MDFSWSDELEDYKKKVVRFAQEELNNNLYERDQKSEFPADLWKKCADFGIMGLAAPKEYGGGFDKIDLQRGALAMEAIGFGCKDNGLSNALNAQLWTVQMTLALFANEEQKKRFLPAMVKGKLLGGHGLTEPESGSDIFAMQTQAEKVEGGYLLNGKKRLVTLAPIADMVIVFAATNAKLGKWGLSGFILEKRFDGYNPSPAQQKMGLRTAPIGEIILTDCFVPEKNLLGKIGAGFSMINHSLEYDRCFILAGKLGSMQRQLDESIAYVKKRKQFGQAIGKFQSVANRIVEMKLRIETSRLLLHKVAWLMNNKKPALMEAALLKLYLSESFVNSSLDAIRNHGGIGFLSENEVERDLRDAVGGILYAGTSDIQRNIIAALLGL